MSEKKVLKVSLWTIISIVIIVLLAGLLIGVWFYYNKQLRSACGSDKTKVTADEFKQFIEKRGFNIQNAEELNLNSVLMNGLKKGYCTEKNDKADYRINFFEFSDDNILMYEFYESVVSTEINNNGTLIKESKTTLNTSKYTAELDGKYYVISRIGNTILWATIDAENQQTLKDLVSELGY